MTIFDKIHRIGISFELDKDVMLYLMNERQQELLYYVNEKEKIKVTELASLLNVSVVTIRHDLTYLEQNGFLKREHGFALSNESDNLEDRLKVKYPLKLSIAEYAASLVENGDSIFIEGGSTNALLAQCLSYTRRCTIITSSCYIAQLLKNSDLNIILLGGDYQKKSDSIVGELAKISVKNLSFNKSFIGIDGFSRQLGFSGKNRQRTELVNTILDKPAEHIIITDSSKFSHDSLYPFSTLNAVNRVITDNKLMVEDELYLNTHNIKINRVQED